MSKLNILGIVKNIKSKTNVCTPIVEAVINSIEAIGKQQGGKIEIVVYREILLYDAKPYIKSIEIIDNGVGFTQENTTSFDTYLSTTKIDFGGKGFGRLSFHTIPYLWALEFRLRGLCWFLRWHYSMLHRLMCCCLRI
jgi:hypothetical protein